MVLSLASPPEGQAGGFRKSWGGWAAHHPPSCLIRSPDFADDTSNERRSFCLEWKVQMKEHEVAAAAGATSVVTQGDSPICMEGAAQLWGIPLHSSCLSQHVKSTNSLTFTDLPSPHVNVLPPFELHSQNIDLDATHHNRSPSISPSILTDHIYPKSQCRRKPPIATYGIVSQPCQPRCKLQSCNTYQRGNWFSSPSSTADVSILLSK